MSPAAVMMNARHTEAFHNAMQLSAPNASRLDPHWSQSAAAGFRFPPIEINSGTILMVVWTVLKCKAMKPLLFEISIALGSLTWPTAV